MILIDDAGSGSLIGGTVIGALRIETMEYCYEIIPLKYYTPISFNNKEYLEEAAKLAIKLLQNLSYDKKEEILVCRGYMFDKFRIWLKENDFPFKSTKIEEPLQSMVEKTFEDYTVSLGFPRKFISYTKYPFHFHKILRWVYADYENRKKLCKTGWKSWEKFGSLEVKTSYSFLKKSKYTCLKCGEKIDNHSTVKVLSYISNRPQRIYLHSNC